MDLDWFFDKVNWDPTNYFRYAASISSLCSLFRKPSSSPRSSQPCPVKRDVGWSTVGSTGSPSRKPQSLHGKLSRNTLQGAILEQTFQNLIRFNFAQFLPLPVPPTHPRLGRTRNLRVFDQLGPTRLAPCAGGEHRTTFCVLEARL